MISIGVAVAAFNSGDVIEQCLFGLTDSGFKFVLFDDGSSDDTVEKSRAAISNVDVLFGDGTNWWAGGTRKAVQHCFASGCDSVLMLNPDVFVSAQDVFELANYAKKHPNTIPAALVVDDKNRQQIAWAGSRLKRVLRFPPVYLQQYVARAGDTVESVGTEAYDVDEVHGRAVLITREVYEKLGDLDADRFPQYGADNDYSMRARKLGIKLKILPWVKARLNTETTGMAPWQGLSARDKAKAAYKYLFVRKYGAALPTLLRLNAKHLPATAVLPTTAIQISLSLAAKMGLRNKSKK